jgi:hypothetical protein
MIVWKELYHLGRDRLALDDVLNPVDAIGALLAVRQRPEIP